MDPNRKRRNRRQPVILIDSDSDDDDDCAFVSEKQPATKSKTVSSPIELLDSDSDSDSDSDLEEENQHPQFRHRHKRRDAEAADRVLAERLQGDECAARAARDARKGKRRAADFRRATIRGVDDITVAKQRAEKALREEQDEEFQRGLLADQIKDIERRTAEEKEAREKEEREDARRLAEAKEASAMDDARALMERAGPEPRIGSDGVTCLRFALPTGQKVDRRFSATDTVKTLRAFMLLHLEEKGLVDMKNIGFSTNFPKRLLLEADDHLTLEEAGVAPQALLMVINLDS